MQDKFRVIITLPYLFSVRDFLFTSLWKEMEKRKNVEFVLKTNNIHVKKIISERKSLNIKNFERSLPEYGCTDLAKKIFNKAIGYREVLVAWYLVKVRKYDSKYLTPALRIRFGELNDLSNLRIYKEKSSSEQIRQQILSDYRSGLSVGKPFPASRVVFRILFKLRQKIYSVFHAKDYFSLRRLKPDLFVFGRLQWSGDMYWIKILKRLQIPMVSYIASWDHPTTKGPIPAGMSRYIVASKRMVEEMNGLHGITREKICQVGKVQMDIYNNPTILKSREDFLKELGVPRDHRLITLGTNTTGLKEHEVSIAKRLAKWVINYRYGKVTLLLRTHPQDVNWERDFLTLEKQPWVICKDANSFGNRSSDDMTEGNVDQRILANLMKHSDVVIQSRGSLALDSIAFDTPVISLAFDGDLRRSPNDSYLWEYNYEHYKPIIAAQGTWVVGSYNALDHAIKSYLKDPSIHAEGREIIRDKQLAPLDGKAAQRFVDYLVESAQWARQGTFPDGDWKHTGLDDTTWASRQNCDVQDYVDE